MSSDSSTTPQASGLQPCQAVTADPVQGTKDWHKTLSQDLRDHLVQRLALTIFPTPGLQAINNLVACARQLEKEMYLMADTRSEYLHMLLAQKINKIQQELSEKRSLARSGVLPASGSSCQPLPMHSVAAFNLFLSMPLFAKAVEKDRSRTKMILRLALGVSDDGQVGSILPCKEDEAGLHILPFQFLQQVLDAHSADRNAGILLRQQAVDMGVVQLLLACLAVFTQQVKSDTVAVPSEFSVLTVIRV